MRTAPDVEITGEVVGLSAERDAAGAVLIAYVNTAHGTTSSGGKPGRVCLRLSEEDTDHVLRRLGEPHTSWDVEHGVLTREQLATVKARAKALAEVPVDQVPSGDAGEWARRAGKVLLDIPVLLADADASRWLLRRVHDEHARLTAAALTSLAAAGEPDPLSHLRAALAAQGQLPAGAANAG